MTGLGSDHHGFALKRQLLRFLAARGEEVWDFGSYTEEPVDYPDVATIVAEAVRCGLIERGVLVCATGLGMAIVANKVPGVRAAPVVDLLTARLARESNDAQVITLGQEIVGADLACELVAAWLEAEFRGGGSARKVEKIRLLEERVQHGPALQVAGGGRAC
jgi:ribose 5-phosphate isomerase B